MRSSFLIVVISFFIPSSLVSSPAFGELIGYWSFDEGAGNTIGDSSPFGNHGTLFNGSWTAGKFGTAVDFNPSLKTQVRIADSSSLYTPNQLTVAAWVYSRDLTRDAPIFAQEGNGGLAVNLQTNQQRVGILLEKGNDGEGGYDWDFLGFQSAGMSPLEWTHLATTWDGSTVRLYKNGQLMPTTFSFSGTLMDSNYSFGIGVNSVWDSTHFDGLIDEVRFYNRALSEAEITAISAVPEPSSCCLVTVGMLGLLRFFRRKISK